MSLSDLYPSVEAWKRGLFLKGSENEVGTNHEVDTNHSHNRLLFYGHRRTGSSHHGPALAAEQWVGVLLGRVSCGSDNSKDRCALIDRVSVAPSPQASWPSSE